MFTASGSSGICSEPASGGGIPSSGTGLRMTSMRSAASVPMSRRPRNSAERVQTMRALVMRSQIPSRSAIVISPMVALEDSTPWMPLILIWRFGVDS